MLYNVCRCVGVFDHPSHADLELKEGRSTNHDAGLRRMVNVGHWLPPGDHRRLTEILFQGKPRKPGRNHRVYQLYKI